MGAHRAHIPGEGLRSLLLAGFPSPGSRKRDPTSPLRGEVKGDAAIRLIQPYRNLL